MKLNYKRTFFIGLAFLSISAFWQMYDNIIPLILQNTFGIKESVSGVIMSLDNVLAVFLLPLIGGLSDKVDTKWGKRTPFVVLGTIAAIICMMLMPLADANKQMILFVVALGLTLIAMAMYRSPAVALMPDLTPKPLRSAANAVINLMGAIGGVYTLVLIKTLVAKGERPSYLPVFIGVAAMMLLSIIILVLTIKEKLLAKQIAEEYPEDASSSANIEACANNEASDTSKTSSDSAKLPKDVKRSLVFILVSIFLWFAAYNAVTTAFSRYAVKVWKLEGGGFADCLLVATIAAIISYIPIGILASKFGRKKMIIAGLFMMLTSFCAVFFYPTYHFSANIFFALIGMGWASIGVNSLPMVVEMSKNSDLGKYTGLYYTFSMSAQIFTPIASGALLQYVSYNTLFPYAIFFTVCAIITMSMVKHGDSKPERKKKIIENFDVED
ncbi:MAG: SLC45 family MFS transporter [Lachnospiraceae bacterium]|nr:SLC45 family MFS transporter [Lachnospiraceae bacterium]